MASSTSMTSPLKNENVFKIYTSIFQTLIDQNYQQLPQPEIHLPSDKDWQERMYFALLEVQKNINKLSSDVEYETHH